jgi:hypothetical protein
MFTCFSKKKKTLNEIQGSATNGDDDLGYDAM